MKAQKIEEAVLERSFTLKFSMADAAILNSAMYLFVGVARSGDEKMLRKIIGHSGIENVDNTVRCMMELFSKKETANVLVNLSNEICSVVQDLAKQIMRETNHENNN